ncbi:AAA family ATPase [Vibrio vulnificus]|uniref:AAA family ATPase n=1 Tax=Vibrio vulnificus TaxID=672 RepID=UPI0040587B79
MKLKKIEIQAFKSYLYKNDGTFDFINQRTGQAANFVSLFAPNGFGKTSFFDAIDFAITGKITRYVRNDKIERLNVEESKQHNEKDESQLIIRNKKAPKSLSTEVIVSTNDPKRTFTSEYKKGRKGSSDFKIQSQSKKNTFFESSMLYQESIDSFLRETDSEARFRKFSEIDEELKEIHSTRTKLIAVKSDLRKRIDGSIEEKIRLEKNIDNKKNNDNSKNYINKIISEVNEYNLFNKIEKIELPYTSDDKLKLSSQLKANITSLDDQISVNNDSVLNIDKRFALLPQALNEYQSFISDRNELSVLEGLKKTKEIIKERNIKLETIKTRLAQLKEKRNYLENISSELAQYLSLLGRKDVLTKQIDSANTEKAKNDIRVSSLNEQLAINNSLKKSLTAEIQKLNVEKSSAESKFLELRSLEFEKEKFNERLIELNQTKDKINTDITRLEKSINDLKEIKLGEFSSISSLDEDFYAKIENFNTQYFSNIAIKNQLKKDLSVNSDELSNIKKYKSDIALVIEKSLEIISETKQEHCPLCEKKHDDYEALARSISNNSSLSVLEKSKTLVLKGIYKDIADVDDNLTSISNAFNELLSQTQIELREKVGLKHLSLKDVTSKIVLQTELINTTEEKINQFINIASFSSVEDYVNYLSALIVNENSKFEGYQANEYQILSELKEVLTPNEASKNLLGYGKELFEVNSLLERYQYVTDYIEQKSITSTISFEVVNDTLSYEIKSILSQQKALSESEKLTSDEIMSLTSSVSKSMYFSSNIDEISVLIETKNTKVYSFVESYQWLIDVVSHNVAHDLNDINSLFNYVSEHLSDVKNKLNKQNDSNYQIISTLNAIEEVACNFVYLESKDSDVEDLEATIRQIEKLKVLSRALTKDIAFLGKEIESRVDSFFNTELINTIYRSIDPHPEYKNIVFKCTSEDKPKLLVSAKSDTSDSLMSPTLNFSSAQINVLALSIFLAKALDVRDENDNPVDCILIDDPVQSIDAINTLGLIDTLRMISLKFNKQIIVTTHDENFHELLKKKVPDDVFSSKFLSLKSFGSVTAD